MTKQALIVWGGWDGHTPKQSADIFAAFLKQQKYNVTVSDTLDSYLDADLMAKLDLIVPIWTMGEITNEQWQALDATIRSGTGIAGFHGGIIDSFRLNEGYQFMTGGQWVAHPGNSEASYTVNITNTDHEITRGITNFEMKKTEQYYCHTDPANNILCSTVITGEFGDASLYQPNTTLPYAWTKTWGKGRVFVACWGHTYNDFDVPQARLIVERGMLWASK